MPFRFRFSDPKQNIDVGFFKLFLSTSSLDLSEINQPSLVANELSGRHELRDMDRLCEAAYKHVWDTLTITIVQRRSK